MAISITNVAKNSLKFSTVQVVGAIFAIASSMYVATIVMPDEYGIYGFLILWLTYASLIGFGFMGAGSREMPSLLGKGEIKEAVRIQNVSLTPEILYSFIPFLVIIIVSFFYSDTVIRIGMIIIAFSYLTSRLANFWSNYNFIRERFNTVAIANLIQAIAVPVITVALVNWLKVYALLLVPLVINIVLWVYYLRKGAIDFHFQIDRREIARLFKIGVILQFGSLVYWAYQLAGRTVIASLLSQEQLGYYTFAIGFIMVVISIPVSFTNILQPILWRNALSNVIGGFKEAKRIIVYLALGTSFLIPLAQLGFYVVVNLITKNYAQSIPVFNILSYSIYLMAMTAVPSIVLNSAIVNRQRLLMILYAVGLLINIGFSILVIKLGYGILGVSWVAVISQALLSIAIYYLAWRYIFDDKKDYLKSQLKIYLPLLISALFYILHSYLESHLSDMRTVVSISIIAQIVIWALVISIFYRNYLSFKEVAVLFKGINK